MNEVVEEWMAPSPLDYLSRGASIMHIYISMLDLRVHAGDRVPKLIGWIFMGT